MIRNWFGIYCPQHNVWLHNTDGSLIHYPALEIAQALIDEDLPFPLGFRKAHLWEATEFGKQKPIKTETLPVGALVCEA